MSTKIFHNPHCSKSRATLQILEDKAIKPTIVEYLKTPPTRDELEEILDFLKIQPRDIMRKNESVYKEKNLADDSLSRDDLIQAMLDNPILIERPIVIVDGKAAIGRPPENVLTIIES